MIDFLAGLACGIVSLAFIEGIVKPMAVSATQDLFRHYAMPGLKKLDELITLPEQWEQLTDNGLIYIKDAVLPNVPHYSLLTEADKSAIAKMIISEFNLQTYLDKHNENGN